jgi:hypothetical protein
MFARLSALILVGVAACGGSSSSLIRTSEEPAGENCAAGGTRLEHGVDEDGSGVLEGAEVGGTAFICHGAQGDEGAQGESGSVSLIDVQDEPAGENCPWGGSAVSHGVDDDGDGVLAADEVDGVSYVCEPRPCDGWLFDAGNGMGCWYNAPEVGMSCNQVCAEHGGFDQVASQHVGNPVGMHFWASKFSGVTWMSVEVSSVDNNTNWGANGDVPDGDFSHSQSLVNCACVN